MSDDRQRRSAKTVITDMVTDMLNRTSDPDVNVKLNLLQTICARMSWNDLFERIKNRHRHSIPVVEREQPEMTEKWWQK